MIYDDFLPGRWMDNIDVNDFVSLNKKPFFEARNLTKKTNKIKVTNFNTQIKNKILQYKEEKEINWNYEEIIPDVLKKMIKIKLINGLKQIEDLHHSQPDIRRIALYGTEKLIQDDKKWYFKYMDLQHQTMHWVQKKKMLIKQIEELKSFERYCYSEFELDVSNPVESAEECMKVILLTILYLCFENPRAVLGLSQSLLFLDIYIEAEMMKGKMKEEDAQRIIDEYRQGIEIIGDFFKLEETVDDTSQCKSIYRYLNCESIENVAMNKIVDKEKYKNLDVNIQKLSYCNKDFLKSTEGMNVFSNGNYAIIGEQLPVDAGACDMEKILYLSLNGGKDVSKNINLTTKVTQPHLKGEITFEEAISKFEDFLEYVINIYTKSINIYLQIYELEKKDYFHQALISNTYQFVSFFRFTNMENVCKILSSVKNNHYQILRSKNWIGEVKIEEDKRNYEQEAEISYQIYHFIKNEVNKLPIFEKGQARIKINQKNISNQFEEKELTRVWTYLGDVNNFDDGIVTIEINNQDERRNTLKLFHEKIFQIKMY